MKVYNVGNRVMNTYICPVNDYFVMIDTGYENSFKSVSEKMKKCGLKFSQIKYVFLTHAHDDHAGFLKKLLKKYPHIRVIADKRALPVLRRGQNSFKGGCAGFEAFSFCKFMALIGRGDHLFPAVGEEFLDRFLIISGENIPELEQKLGGKILFTPGHTSDSVSLKVGERVFCGDAAMNGIPSRNKITIWIEDKAAYRRSWDVLLKQNARLIFPAHGKPFPPDELAKNKSEIAKRTLYTLKQRRAL